MSKFTKYISRKKSSIIILPFNRKACFVLSFIGEIQTAVVPQGQGTKCVFCVRQLSALAQFTVFIQVFFSFVIINNHNHSQNHNHNQNSEQLYSIKISLVYKNTVVNGVVTQ